MITFYRPEVVQLSLTPLYKVEYSEPPTEGSDKISHDTILSLPTKAQAYLALSYILELYLSAETSIQNFAPNCGIWCEIL
jgi:hypothetical protein